MIRKYCKLFCHHDVFSNKENFHNEYLDFFVILQLQFTFFFLILRFFMFHSIFNDLNRFDIYHFLLFVLLVLIVIVIILLFVELSLSFEFLKLVFLLIFVHLWNVYVLIFQIQLLHLQVISLFNLISLLMID